MLKKINEITLLSDMFIVVFFLKVQTIIIMWHKFCTLSNTVNIMLKIRSYILEINNINTK